MPEVPPKKCLHPKPTSQTTLFCGAFINISHLSLATGITQSHLSRIFSGERTPSLKAVKNIADALGLAVGTFIAGLESHTQLKQYYSTKKSSVEAPDKQEVPVL